MFDFFFLLTARLQSSGSQVPWSDRMLQKGGFCTDLLHELRVSTVTLCVITALSFAAALLIAANLAWREASILSLAQGQ